MSSPATCRGNGRTLAAVPPAPLAGYLLVIPALPSTR